MKWSSISFEDMTINIEKTLTYADEWFLDDPKTDNSLRTIKVNEFVIAMLKEHKEKQEEAKKIVGKAWKQPDMMFISSTGNNYDRSLLNSQFTRFLKKNKMPHLTLHGLRHTYASILMDNEVGIKTISAQLGHCNIGVTGDIYLYVLNKQKAKVTTVIDSELL